MTSVRWLIAILLGALLVGSLALAGCNGDSGAKEGGATPTEEATAEATATATGEAHSETPGPDAVTVNLTTTEGDEWDIETDTDPLPAGQITFVITNPAESEHEHEVEILQGASGTDQDELAEVEEIQPGETKTLTVTLEPGSYELACAITEEHDGEEIDHYERGMHRDIEVQ
jgi:uncharacterized cupredoxin-like copper-binding protein